ncbi:MAG: protein-glutamate O-methyltransferase [Rhodospirillales bacterium]
MTPQDFAYLASLIHNRSGIVLPAEKAYLLENRLRPLSGEFSFGSMADLVSALKLNRDERLARRVVEVMTTNETLFFRDTKPFDLLRDVVLPQLIEARAKGRPLRIWSAACSAGQEPYSIAMTIKENAARFGAWPIEILATDLSSTVLAKARSGIYSQFEVQRGLPIRLLVRYFTQNEAQWTIHPEIRTMVQFRQHNILEDVSSLGQFDVVFCRNVLIYFDGETKKQVLERIAHSLAPNGALFLGGTETVIGITDRFEPIPGQRGIYRATEADPCLVRDRPSSIKAPSVNGRHRAA